MDISRFSDDDALFRVQVEATVDLAARHIATIVALHTGCLGVAARTSAATADSTAAAAGHTLMARLLEQASGIGGPPPPATPALGSGPRS